MASEDHAKAGEETSVSEAQVAEPEPDRSAKTPARLETAASKLVAEPEASMPEIAMLVRPGGDARPFGALFQFWSRRMAPAPFPRLIALEPGPITLDNGLRLLPNAYLPQAQAPRLLILTLQNGKMLGNLELAFARRILAEGGWVWVIGEQLPEGLRVQELGGLDSPLLINGEELEARLFEASWETEKASKPRQKRR